jgi:glucoamylase
MWLDGSPFWTAIQLDETALPILVVDLAQRHGAVGEGDLRRLWPMVRRAAGFLARNGPVSPQDRWENEGGYSPFTLAVAIAALLFAADQAERNGEPQVARYLRETSDAWNASIERWIYATQTPLAAELGIEGYYVRISEPERDESTEERSTAAKHRPESHVISPDALALVRFGLRGADDPRIESTVQAIDHLLRVEFPAGPGWHRYPADKYGEHADGAPFTGDGQGIGRVWPLLTGERAHFELARGRRDEAERLLHTIESFNRSGMLPEQVWDADDLPERELFFGHPAGSAMPLAWAHAEYLKLARSLRDGAVFDMPPQTVERYLKRQQGSPHVIWRFNHKLLTMPAGRTLRIETRAPARIHWGVENWHRQQDTPTVDTGLGIHYADLPTADLPGDSVINFTFYWPEAGHWEGRDFYVHTEMEPIAVEAMEMA